LRGQSVVAPDVRTLIAAGSLLTAVVGAVLIVLLRVPGRYDEHIHADDATPAYLTR